MATLRIITILILSHLRKSVRHIYWLYRLSRAKLGRDVSISFPLQLEGKGGFLVGDGTQISSNVHIGIGQNSTLEFGKKNVIRDNVTALTGPGGCILFGDGCEIGSYTSLWTNSNWQIGPGSVINTYCSIFARESGANGRFIMGANSHIGDFSTLDICDDLIIGDNVALGGYNIIYTHDHVIQKDGPAWMGGVEKGKVIIEDNVWIGAGVIILPGVTIGRGAVVASGALVNKDVAPYTLVGGIPAKILVKREEASF